MADGGLRPDSRSETTVTPEAFFAGEPLSAELFEIIRQQVEALGGTQMAVTRSQIAFRRRRGFAWVWMPRWVLRGRGAPLVLSVSLPGRDPSARWKEVVEPAPGRFMHHLELWAPADVDAEVGGWLRQAWEDAG